MRRFEPVAAAGGVLLLVSLFLPWYGVDLPASIGDASPFGPAEASGWQILTVIDVLLALIALPAIALPIVSITAEGPAKPIAVAVIASATGWLAVVLVAFRLLDAPGDVDEFLGLRYGIWLALAGALIAWIGSWLTMRDESTPGAVAPDIQRRPAPPTRAA